MADAETGARALTVADAERGAVARRADAATEARGGKGPVLERRYVEGRLGSRLHFNRLSSRLHSSSDGDNGQPRHRGKGDDGVDQRRRGRRCGRSTVGATLRSIISGGDAAVDHRRGRRCGRSSEGATLRSIIGGGDAAVDHRRGATVASIIGGGDAAVDHRGGYGYRK